MLVEQVQPEEWGTFRIPVRVDVVNEAGERSTATIDMTERAARATLELPADATKIEVDPSGDVLMTAEVAWSDEEND